jgi:pimeloyl-ACP methyl ester carboxylesterase/DNA-binding CsgD family transcriptional regulator
MAKENSSRTRVAGGTRTGTNPDSFEALMETWNSMFERSVRGDERTFADVEQAAFKLSQDVAVPAPHTAVGRQVGQLLEQFGSPVFLVRENGRVITQNAVALRTYGIGPDDNLDDLPFDLEQDELFADVVRGTLSPSRNMQEAVLKRGYSTYDESTVTLSITPSKPLVAGQGEALVFVVDARWKTECAGLIKREFDLTEAEKELLVAFLDGQTTQEMATSRNRSHATVRTQFHSLMTKMGSRNQVELFRNALSISQFVDKVDNIAEVLRHPFRKRVDVVRPGGRSVEVTMAGDFTGKPLVFLPGCNAYTFEASVEEAFHDAGFCVLSICRPGTGDTDPSPDISSYHETSAGDICALLDQLGHEKCLLMTSNTSTGFLFHTLPYFEERVFGLTLAAAGAPMRYYEDADFSAPWIKGMFHAVAKRPKILKFFLKAGTSAYRTIGQKRFTELQFSNDPKELEIVNRPEYKQEMDNALEVYTRQGMTSLHTDISLCFSDYTDEVCKTDLPILILHGSGDQINGIGAMRRFVEDFADQTTLVEIESATQSAIHTHTAKIISELIAFEERYAAGSGSHRTPQVFKH